jgi:hypothetical protein
MEFFALLLLVGIVVRYWYLIAAVAGMMVAAHWTRPAVDRHIERVEAERRRVAGLVARADQQHAWVMQGDERGVYGEFSPAPV